MNKIESRTHSKPMEQVQDGRCLSSHFITKWPYSWDSWCPSREGQAHLTSQPRRQFISRLWTHFPRGAPVVPSPWIWRAWGWDMGIPGMSTPHFADSPSEHWAQPQREVLSPGTQSHRQSGPASVFTHLGGVRGSAPATSGPISQAAGSHPSALTHLPRSGYQPKWKDSRNWASLWITLLDPVTYLNCSASMTFAYGALDGLVACTSLYHGLSTITSLCSWVHLGKG